LPKKLNGDKRVRIPPVIFNYNHIGSVTLAVIPSVGSKAQLNIFAAIFMELTANVEANRRRNKFLRMIFFELF
jgi:hypothetical protein